MKCMVSKVFRDDVRLEPCEMCQSHECASRVPDDSKDKQQTSTKNSKNSFPGSRVSTQPQLTAALSSTNQRAESSVVVNVVLLFLHTQSACFLQTDLFISRLRRVEAEPDHTHTTWRFFTRETGRSSDCVHFSFLCYTQKHTKCHLDLHTSLTCVQRVDHSK